MKLINRLSQKILETDVIEFARTQLTLPDKLDPADEMSWQHYLYSKLGKTEPEFIEATEKQPATTTAVEKTKEKIIEETVERIVAMAKVLFGLHMVSIAASNHINCRVGYVISLLLSSELFTD